MAGQRKTQPQKSVLDEAIDMVKTGAFSILSDRAQDRLILMFQAVQREGYDHGFEVAEAAQRGRVDV